VVRWAADGYRVGLFVALRLVDSVLRSWPRLSSRRGGLIGVIAVCAAAGLAAVAPMSASARLTWGTPTLVDATPPLADSSFTPAGLACPSAGLCVAVDSTGGNAITWSNPAQGHPQWSAVEVNAPCPFENYGYCSTGVDGLGAVGCPTVTLCVVGGPDDVLYTSVGPAGAPWHEINTPGFSVTVGTIAGVACASGSSCIAVDGAGNVLSSSDPTTAWELAKVDAHPLTAAACPSASLCVAVDDVGDVLTSDNPAGGAAAWATAPIDPGRGLTSVACPSVDLCVAVDTAGNVLTSPDPAGGASAWSIAPVDLGHAMSSVSCPAVTLCVAVDTNRDLAESTDPAGGAAAWTVAPLSRAVARTSPTSTVSVSCPSTALCVAIDGIGDTWSSTEPTGGATTWTPSQVGRFNQMLALACPNASLCVAGDDAGNIVSSTNPTGGPSAWSMSPVEPGHSIASIACASPSLCIAADYRGDLLTAENPSAGASAWTRARLSTAALTVRCTSAGRRRQRGRRRLSRPQTLCLAFDTHGRLFATTDPRHGASAWTALGRPVRHLAAVSCPSTSLCIALTASNSLVSSRDPTSQHATWTVHRSRAVRSEDGSASGSAISCPSATLCVGTFNVTDGKYFWSLVASANASARRIKWRNVATSGGPGNGGGAIYPACISTSLCFAFGGVGMISSTHPAGGRHAWAQTGVLDIPNAVACPSVRMCVAVDTAGNVLLGSG
jgi:hypothetical protein